MDTKAIEDLIEFERARNPDWALPAVARKQLVDIKYKLAELENAKPEEAWTDGMTEDMIAKAQ